MVELQITNWACGISDAFDISLLHGSQHNVFIVEEVVMYPGVLTKIAEHTENVPIL